MPAPTPGSIVRRLRKERFWTQDKLGQKARSEPELAGRGKGFWSDFENDKVTPTEELRSAFASVFGLSLEEFDAMWMPERSKRRGTKPRPAPVGIPVVNKAPAGAVVDYDHDQYDGEYHSAADYIDRGSVVQADAYAVVVEGNSMEPTFRSGDTCIFKPVHADRPQDKPRPGDVVFLRFSKDAPEVGCQIARYQSTTDGVWHLSKDNPLFDDLVVNPEHLDRLGVFVEHRKRWA